MAFNVILGTGFDAFATADLATIFSSVSGTINTNTTHTPFNVGRSLSLLNQGASFIPPTASANYIVGFYYKNQTAATINGTLVQFKQGASDQLCIKWEAGNTGKIEIRRGAFNGTLLGTTASAVTTDGAFVHIEIKVRINPSISSGDVVIYANGSSVLTLSAGTNTRATSTSAADEIRIGDGLVAAASLYIDDLFIIDWSSGDSGQVGRTRFYALRPNANGDFSDFVGSDGNSTDNYALVNSAPFASASYVGSGVAGAVDVYGLENLSVTPSTIHAVVAHCSLQVPDAGKRTCRPTLRIGGTNYDSGVDIVPSLSFMTRSVIFTSNPAGGVWGASAINNMQAGIKVVT